MNNIIKEVHKFKNQNSGKVVNVGITLNNTRWDGKTSSVNLLMPSGEQHTFFIRGETMQDAIDEFLKMFYADYVGKA